MSIVGVVIGISMLTSITAALADDMLIDRGRVIFLQETFGGNGRTCATCHRPENNYTIDPTYISGLPPSDPLFVAEWNPTLLSLEHPRLLRGLALISVHSDGYDKPGVLRAVPSLSGLSQSMPPSPEIGRSAALGASGDGAPAGGSLRDFIVGAVVEHLPEDARADAGQRFSVSDGGGAQCTRGLHSFTQLSRRVRYCAAHFYVA